MITTAAAARNIQLIAGTIITSHTGIAYHFEHDAQGTGPHHGFNLLISVECTYVEEYYPERSLLYSVTCLSHCLWTSRRNLRHSEIL